jgi:hypothetical protein
MTPKEKAKELVSKFMNIDSDSKFFDGFNMPLFYSQRCALIAVNEIIDILTIKNYSDVDDYEYWNKVKYEIENL